jgi:hypothetical protein
VTDEAAPEGLKAPRICAKEGVADEPLPQHQVLYSVDLTAKGRVLFETLGDLLNG